MQLQTLPRTYLLPANSQAINKALTTLAALGIAHEGPRAASNPTETLFSLVVHVPVIPVVHYLDLIEMRHELLADRKTRTERPSHQEAISGNYGTMLTAYPDFFTSSAQAELTYSVTDLVVRERIIRHFATKEIAVRKITLSKSANEALGGGRFFPNDEWYAFAEEARSVIPELATLLGAV